MNLASDATRNMRVYGERTVKECWAKCLGNCKGKITAEHIITEKIWGSDEIGVMGFPSWCPTERKWIGVENFKKNMLCERHNSTLSPVDEGGIAAFGAFRQAAAVHHQRSLNIEAGFRTGRFDVYPYDFDGPLLERWFLKTLINMELAGDQKLVIGPYFDQPVPACELVEAAYGRSTLSGNRGLYAVASLGASVKMEERIKFTSRVASSPHGEFVAAGEFIFFGFTFLLVLVPTANGDAKGPSTSAPVIHRPNRLLFTANEEPSQEITITW
jgi:hypothetical protein